MQITDLVLQTQTIMNHLADEESMDIYRAKIEYSITKDLPTYINHIRKYLKNGSNFELKKYAEQLKTKKIVIRGAGEIGRLNCLAVSFLKQYEIVCFADKNSNTIGSIDNIPVISVEEAVEKYKNAIFIVASHAFKNEMIDELKELGVAEKNILIPKYQYLMTMFGNQYFDVYKSEEEEIFVDAGAFDGSTTLAFKQWSGKKDSTSYIIEPIPSQCDKIEQRIEKEQWSNCKVFSAAVWNKNEKLHICASETGSTVSECGISVEGKCIDDIVGNNKVTYIKMDVEGAELNALHGAKYTIKTQKPRLAICIYHKPEDVWTIPLYLLELVPEYRFKIRHYTSREWETVLYASIAD